MSLQTIIEIAVGLIFTWLVLSIAAMYIQELVVTKLRWRSHMLETYIGNLLSDPQLAQKFYDHPLIQGLHSGEDGTHKPSYIPSRMFTMTLFDMIIAAGQPVSLLRQEIGKFRAAMDKLESDDKARTDLQFDLFINTVRLALKTQAGEKALQTAIEAGKAEIKKVGAVDPLLQEVIDQAISNVNLSAPELDAVLQNIQTARQTQGEGTAPETDTLAQLRDGLAVMTVSQPQLKQAVEGLLRGAEDYVGKGESALLNARQSVEKWFDDGMDRLSGWYKRRSQKLGIVIGISIAVIFNADTIALAQTLWREPVIREALVAQAEAYTQKNPERVAPATAEELNALQLQFSSLNIPIGWLGTGLPADASGGVTMLDGSQKLCTLLPSSPTHYYGLKMGNRCYPVINAPALNDLPGILMKLFGLLASGLAAAQGAPFWFDILKKAINIRSSGGVTTEGSK